MVVVDGLLSMGATVRGHRGQGSRKLWARRSRGTNCTGGSKSRTHRFKSRYYEEDTDDATDYLCTSRTVSSAYTEERDTGESVDVDNISSSPTFSKGRGNILNSPSVSCAYTKERLTGDSVDVVLVTPPKENHKHTPVMEDDDDDFDQPPITLGAEDCGGQTFPKGRGNISTSPPVSCPHNDATEIVDCVDVVLVTPAKTINKDNRGLEDDVDFVRQSISEVNESEGGDVDVVLVNPPKQNPQTQPCDGK